MNQEQKASGPGIVVLSPSMRVLHMNRRAVALLARLDRTAQATGTEQALAAPLHQHCRDIIETLQARLASNNWERFHQYRVIGDADRSILLKGFGLADRRGLPASRILMLLSPHSPAPMPGITRGKSPSLAADGLSGSSGLSGSTK